MKTVQEIIDESALANGPRVSELVRIRPGGVDPLGLRQINFNLMDQLLPQLNNVARHIRPLTVMAWAWRCAWKSAETIGLDKVPASTLREMVDRIEVIFVWSQLLVHDSVDLPGSAYLKTRLPESSYRFAGEHWTQMQKERRYSTALSAAVNYGPSLFNLCFARRGAQRDEVRLHPLADAALNSLDSLLGDQRNHSAFTKFGEVTVTQADLKLWGGLWDIEKITNAECEHIATTLGGKEAPLERQHGIRLLKTAIERIGVRGDSAVRKAMCDCGAAHDNSQLQESTAVWRGIQARQLFRLTLEALLYWATVEVSDRPSTVERMASRFLEGTPSEHTVEAWLAIPADPDAVDIIEPILELEKLLRGRVDANSLPSVIYQGLRAALACKAIDSNERQDRLPLERAQTEAKSFADKSPAQFMEYILSAWAIGQHVYWSVGRGIGDARRGQDRILRLKIVPDEAGLRIVPGANNSAPRTTPDRLSTAITLLQEAGELQMS